MFTTTINNTDHSDQLLVVISRQHLAKAELRIWLCGRDLRSGLAGGLPCRTSRYLMPSAILDSFCVASAKGQVAVFK